MTRAPDLLSKLDVAGSSPVARSLQVIERRGNARADPWEGVGSCIICGVEKYAPVGDVPSSVRGALRGRALASRARHEYSPHARVMLWPPPTPAHRVLGICVRRADRRQADCETDDTYAAIA